MDKITMFVDEYDAVAAAAAPAVTIWWSSIRASLLLGMNMVSLAYSLGQYTLFSHAPFAVVCVYRFSSIHNVHNMRNESYD